MKTRMLSASLALLCILVLTACTNNGVSNGSARTATSPGTAGVGAPATTTADLPSDDPRTRHRKWKYQPQTKTVTLVGEVVDSWCYSSQVMGPGRGERHKACGLACAHGGVTLGIVDDDGTLYICAKHKGYTGCKDLLTPFMAKRVQVRGWLAQKGGCNVLKIADVEEVKLPASATTSTSETGAGSASPPNAGAAPAAEPKAPGASSTAPGEHPPAVAK